ncbi:MAG: thermonuclease family protein, partial [Bartonella sp.]|nr:thermonuclease family protein [Bartonella sp.]
MKKKSHFDLKSFNLKVIGLSIIIAATILIVTVIYFQYTQTHPKKAAFISKESLEGHAFII